MRTKSRLVALAVATLAMWATAAHAASGLPLPLQAALISKLVHYDRSLPGDPGAIKMLIVYQQKTPENDQLREGLQKLGVHSELVGADQLATWAGDVNIVYLMPDVPIEAARQFAEKHKALSLTGSAELAEKGQVAVALSKGADDRPEIVVHLARLGVEKHEFAASLLGLARVVR